MNYMITEDNEESVRFIFIDTDTFVTRYRRELRLRDLYIHFNGAVVRCYDKPEWRRHVQRLYVPGQYTDMDHNSLEVSWCYWPMVREMLHVVIEAINNHEL